MGSYLGGVDAGCCVDGVDVGQVEDVVVLADALVHPLEVGDFDFNFTCPSWLV